jgi:hypothetical protein
MVVFDTKFQANKMLPSEINGAVSSALFGGVDSAK